MADLATWRNGDEADTEVRNKAGLLKVPVMRNANDPSEVVILFEVKDPKRAGEFSNSSERRRTLVKAGVLGKPAVRFLN